MRKSKRIKIKKMYSEMVKAGKYNIAYLLLQLLIKHYVTLWLDDDSYETQLKLEKINCNMWYASNGNKVIAYDYGY